MLGPSVLRGAPGVVLLLVAALALLPVGGCGKKPEFVDPPPDADPDRFPRTYPAY